MDALPSALLERCYSSGHKEMKTMNVVLRAYIHMGKAHKNCIIGQKLCLHHITGTAFIIRLKLYVCIVENSETFQKIYSFMQFK